MKILQNPIAVGVLAVVAVALLFYQIAWPMMHHSHGMQPAPAAAITAASGPKPASRVEPGKPAPAPATAVKAMPEMKIDGGAAGASAARAAESPRRDPFQGQLLAVNPTKPYPPAKDLLTFQGVWHQGGSTSAVISNPATSAETIARSINGVTLAVINNRVIAVGDSILSFKVESIEHDRVWVEGPNGRESVEFGTGHALPPAAPPTNSTPPARPDK